MLQFLGYERGEVSSPLGFFLLLKLLAALQTTIETTFRTQNKRTEKKRPFELIVLM